MRFGSLFSGIGGLDLGLERAGMTCAWQVEIDGYCNKVLSKHWPSVPRFRDVREVGRNNLPAVDLIAGGFPCQDISVAGSGTGLAGKRSGLWFEFIRIVRELRPQFVIVENVSALLVRGMDAVLRGLAESGFNAEWRVFSAAEMGAPHRRERVFIVAYRDSVGGRRGGYFNRQDDIQTGCQWNAAPCCSEWRQLERWLVESVQTGNGVLATSELRRVDDGLSDRSHRLRGLGNAVVPQVAEWIGRRILEVA